MGFGILDNTWLLNYNPLIKKKKKSARQELDAQLLFFLYDCVLLFHTNFSIKTVITRCTFLEHIQFFK